MWLEAAQWAGVYEAWVVGKLDGKEMSLIVAHFLTRQQIDAVIAYKAEIKARQANRAEGRTGRPRPKHR